MGYELKFFKNLKKSREDGFSAHFSNLAKKRLEASLREMAMATIKGRVTHICVEVAPIERSLMIEIASDPNVMNDLIIKPTREPNQFIVALRTLDELFSN